MLKLKDSVDLKELEKYGLKRGRKYYTNGEICVNIESRYILVCNIGYSPYSEFTKNKNMYNSQRLYIGDVLYKLITDGLVERPLEVITGKVAYVSGDNPIEGVLDIKTVLNSN